MSNESQSLLFERRDDRVKVFKRGQIVAICCVVAGRWSLCHNVHALTSDELVEIADDLRRRNSPAGPPVPRRKALPR